ncbi:MAG TPA: VanZ family protein [Steroidobacteraceae bacterium]|nr:VanZ family protein [Steroidobacteraceae bacterium]
MVSACWIIGWVLLATVIYTGLEPARYVPNLHVSDKVEHATAYFAMCFWFGGLLERRRYPLLTVGLLALGAAIEVAQGWMGWGRTADFRDFIADAAGVAVGLGFLWAGFGGWAYRLERRFRLSREPS